MSDHPNRSLDFNPEAQDQNSRKDHNHLLLIGIDAYAQVGKLANAVRDARAFKELMVSKYAFDSARCIELYDTKANRRGIMRQLRKMIELVQPGDNLLVYFSGHGHYDEQIEEAYWVPVDAEYQEIDDYISYSFLTKIIKAIPARHSIFIVDSCYSGAALVRGERDLKPERFERDPSRWLLASGRNEVVPDGIAGTHSPFADKLLDILSRYASEGLRMGTLVDKLTTAVSYNSPQTPIGRPLYGVGDQGGEFVFHPRKNETADWADVRAQHTVAAYEGFLKAYPDSPHREDAHWAIAQLKDKIPAYRRYLNAYPAGSYAREAISRMAELEEDQVFARALRRGEAALRQYLLDYHPNGRHLLEARQEIQRIEQQHTAQEADRQREAEQARRRKEARLAEEAKRLAEEKAEVARKQEERDQRKKAEEEKRKTRRAAAPAWYQSRIARLLMIGIPVLLLGIWGLSQLGTNGTHPEPPSRLEGGDSLSIPHGVEESQQAELDPPDSAPSEENDPLAQLQAQGYTILVPWINDRAAYRTSDGRMGLVDRNGTLLGKTYNKIEELANGYAVFHQGGKRGYLELASGKAVIPAQYAAAWPFKPNGRAKVKTQEGQVMYINTKGDCVQDCETKSEIVTATPTTADLPIPLPKMIQIAGGSFEMGSNAGGKDEKPVHRVSVSTFYLAETEVTFEQYDYFCEQTGRKEPDHEGWGRGNRPVINVSWEDATAYCRWLSKETGQSYRLPTEAEWEYAAGGGAAGRTIYAGTSSASGLRIYAVYSSNFRTKTQPVKSKKTNGLGLYDMSGNVWEWCADWYDSDYYASSPEKNPKGPTSGSSRVYRGGGWSLHGGTCRVAFRGGSSPGNSRYYLGFRVARSL